MPDIVEIDPARVDELIRAEEAALRPKHARSIAYRDEAARHLPGGVSSSWQTAPPHPVYVTRGQGSRIWDLDGNEYADYHNGYGVMVMGHAHPKVVEAVRSRIGLGSHFAQPTEDALAVAENLAERFGLPYWRFGNSGTEATLDASRLMRALTGRKKLLKIEGSYHGHHDSLMVSVVPPADQMGPRERPRSVPQTLGLPQEFVDLVVCVPFNDSEAAERAFAEHEGEIAGMIVEPVMTNVGVVPPQPGYLEALRDITRRHGALLAYDEVKTGCTVAWGGAVEAFGVVPDFVCLAKAIGAGLPCGAIGGTEESMAQVISGEVDQVGTFNGNPLTMAAAKANLTEVLTKDAYARLDEINAVLAGCDAVIDKYRLPANLTLLGAKGSITYRPELAREYRDVLPIDNRYSYLAWLWQLNRGVFKSPWSKWESWTVSIVHTNRDAQRYVDNFEELAEAITR